jgi:hypothetical protein
MLDKVSPVLHVLNCLAKGQRPDTEVSMEVLLASIDIVNYFIMQKAILQNRGNLFDDFEIQTLMYDWMVKNNTIERAYAPSTFTQNIRHKQEKLPSSKFQSQFSKLKEYGVVTMSDDGKSITLVSGAVFPYFTANSVSEGNFRLIPTSLVEIEALRIKYELSGDLTHFNAEISIEELDDSMQVIF